MYAQRHERAWQSNRHHDPQSPRVVGHRLLALRLAKARELAGLVHVCVCVGEVKGKHMISYYSNLFAKLSIGRNLEAIGRILQNERGSQLCLETGKVFGQPVEPFLGGVGNMRSSKHAEGEGAPSDMDESDVQGWRRIASSTMQQVW